MSFNLGVIDFVKGSSSEDGKNASHGLAARVMEHEGNKINA